VQSDTTRGTTTSTLPGVRLDEIGIEWGIGEGGDYNGGELAVEHRHFKSLTERLIFAQRFLGTYSFGDVPFYEQPKLGSSKTLRGLSADRYRDDARILVNTELRWLGLRLSRRRHIFGGVNVFADVGQVFARGEMPSSGDWRLGLGLGLRLYWYSTIVRADYARSDSDSALYMRFAQIF
jgi:hemolysin activation/secretion protein